MGDRKVLIKVKNHEILQQIKHECPEVTELTRQEAINVYKFYKKNEWEMVERCKMIDGDNYQKL